MVNIEGNRITMVRGDTAKITVDITDTDGTPYVPLAGDSIRFAVKRRYTDSQVLILKEIPNATLFFSIDPDDTKRLKMGEQGKYVYDVEITRADGTVDTFIRGQLWLLEEVD